MANRKKHLKYQARKQPNSKVGLSYQNESAKTSTPTQQKDAVDPAVKATSTSNPIGKTKSKSKPVKAEIFSQLPDQEVSIVKLELRHILFTGSIILISFLSLWLLTHFTQLDEKLYSSLNLIVQTK